MIFRWLHTLDTLHRRRDRRQSHDGNTLDHPAFYCGPELALEYKMRLFGKSFRLKKNNAPHRDRVLFVSHEATRTGAPKIILNLLNQFADKCDVDCESILLRGGHLATEFQEKSVVDCFNVTNEQPDLIRKRVVNFVNRHRGNLPKLAICNSMESRFVAKELKELGIPCVSLIHELPSGYVAEDYRKVFNLSEKVVFPVKFVRDAANHLAPLPSGKTVVVPQGLLDPNFGKGIGHETARSHIRHELNLPKDSFVVLGCGTLDLRKGIDHFANVARRVLQTHPQKKQIQFVWVGEGPRWAHSLFHYVNLDLINSGASGNVHFIGERENVEPYFMGADCFLMASRVDPFPCVVHEAMAAGLPVIAFENAGGAAEAIGDGAGFVVPYGDYEQVAATIRLMSNQPALTAGLRDRSKLRVHQHYQFDEYAEKIIDLCESVIGKRLRISSAAENVTDDFPLRVHRAA